ncbi:hypothetical protein CBM2589_B140029 [Cupriavidus taiwanensis]|uniref:Uncharacterized protein n=1 Tax=Cupriavidus taiwanensis TaxID=164546 RepID=A0A975WWS5_9BURK|nr:hypothetical protein CBM2589_B140029 [Cupriavidus taiwanensis]
MAGALTSIGGTTPKSLSVGSMQRDQEPHSHCAWPGKSAEIKIERPFYFVYACFAQAPEGVVGRGKAADRVKG